MESISFTQQVIGLTIDLLTGKMIPAMFILFGIGLVFRSLLFYTIKREEWISKEFEKRVETYSQSKSQSDSFYSNSRKLLEKTYYEIFELRSLMKRRKPDVILTISDRLFMVQHGSARFVKDILSRIKGVKYSTDKPDFVHITKNTFERNASFSKVFAIIPATAVNDILTILPGVFIVMGILGTFLGIMKALPEIGAIDLANAAQSQAAMNDFLAKISFSMTTSIMGIVFSVVLTLINSIMGVEKKYTAAVERFAGSLDFIWNTSSNNDYESRLSDSEISAAKSLDKELGIESGPLTIVSNEQDQSKEDKAA